MRHTEITEAVHADGADVVDISRVAGHKDLKTTLGYFHVADERAHETVERLPNIVPL